MKQISAAVALSAIGGLHAAPLISENFNAAGILAGSSPSIGAVWQAVDGSGSLQKSSGTLRIEPGISQEVESLFPDVSAGTVYAGLNVQVTSAPASPWILPVTFRGKNVSGGDQVGRLYISTGTSAGHYRVGIENNLDQPVWWPTELSVSASYRLVLGFTENGVEDVTVLWVDPATESDSSISETPENITDAIFGLRLNAYIGSSGAMRIDNLVVTRDFLEAAAPKRFAPPVPATDNAVSQRIASYEKQLKILKTKLAKAKRIRSPLARKSAVQKALKKIRALKRRLAAL